MNAAFFMRNVFNQNNAIASVLGAASIGAFTRPYSEPRLYGVELGFRF